MLHEYTLAALTLKILFVDQIENIKEKMTQPSLREMQQIKSEASNSITFLKTLLWFRFWTLSESVPIHHIVHYIYPSYILYNILLVLVHKKATYFTLSYQGEMMQYIRNCEVRMPRPIKLNKDTAQCFF